MDTLQQNFFKEAFKREEQRRIIWNLRYSRAFGGQHTFQPNNLENRSKLKLTAKDLQGSEGDKKPEKLKLTTKDLQSMQNEKFKRKKISNIPMPNVKAENTGKSFKKAEMRPVSLGTKDILYHGFSSLGGVGGRQAYLNERKNKQPDQKYNFPVTSSWVHGWKINDVMKKASEKPAQFGRREIVQGSFYTANGINFGET